MAACGSIRGIFVSPTPSLDSEASSMLRRSRWLLFRFFVFSLFLKVSPHFQHTPHRPVAHYLFAPSPKQSWLATPVTAAQSPSVLRGGRPSVCVASCLVSCKLRKPRPKNIMSAMMRGVALPVLRSSLRAPSSKIGGRFGRATWTTQQLGKTAPLATVSSLGIDKATGIKNPVSVQCVQLDLFFPQRGSDVFLGCRVG